MRSELSPFVLLILVACSSTPSATPRPKAPATASAQCVSDCEAIHSLCTISANQSGRTPVGSSSGGVLIGAVADSMARKRAVESCSSALGQCYEACASGDRTPASAFTQSCGPVCADGSAAVWLGTATSTEGATTQIMVALCAGADRSVVGNWACAAGSAPCAIPGGSLRGTLAAGSFDATSEAGAIAGASCRFSGTLVGDSLQGQYSCQDPTFGPGRPGFIGSWSVEQCK